MKYYKLKLLIFVISIFLISVGVFMLRQSSVKRDIRAELESAQTVIPLLSTTTHLEIIPLYEEESSNDVLFSGHGVSYLIRTDSSTILLDLGNNPDDLTVAPFMQNLSALGISWDEIDRVVISHLHPDHIGGKKAWLEQSIQFGDLPGGLGERLLFVPSKVTNKGAIHATIPTLPASDIATTGAIPYLEAFPLSLENQKGYEQALVIHVAEQGLVLITGCGHPGLERLVERAESLYGQTVIGVVGGLHFEEANTDQIEPHIRFLQTRQIKLVSLSAHDSSSEALAAFQSAFRDKYYTLRVGEPIQFP